MFFVEFFFFFLGLEIRIRYFQIRSTDTPNIKILILDYSKNYLFFCYSCCDVKFNPSVCVPMILVVI